MKLILIIMLAFCSKVNSQGAGCSNDNQCPSGNGVNGGACVSGFCYCYIGFFGTMCQYGSYSKKNLYGK